MYNGYIMNSPTHFAILGRQPEIGLIELESLLGSDCIEPYGRHALLTSPPDLSRLGGSIKIGRIIARLPLQKLDKLGVDFTQLPRPEEKLTFGVSSYGLRVTSRELEAYGLSVKKLLRAQNSVRYVAPKNGSTELTAAQLKFNRLPDSGFELVILTRHNEMILGLTEQVQDIDAYAARDYDRPARSASVGMLPPKLAQILINTTSSTGVYDPFCGTGVVLQEALLMGKFATGSDLSKEMVVASTTNLNWLAETHDLPSWSIREADAKSVKLSDTNVSIVSEGYLGPNLTREPTPSERSALVQELLPLYRSTLKNLYNQLPNGAEVSLCAPAWRIDGRFRPLEIIDEAVKLGYTIKVFETAPNRTIIYGRDNQIVGRALILLKKV
jgi:tRNA G10  N-methylase Trm11